jgi:hypothetical protein
VEFRLNTTVIKDQWQSTIAPSTAGIVAAWTSRDQDGSLEGIYSQRFGLHR